MNFGDERLPERFWKKCMPEPNSGCWLWLGAKTIQGYGRIKIIGEDRCVMAYRMSYEALVGPIGPRLDIDHLCRNGLCVNPRHLEAVTHRENMLRGTNPVAMQVARVAATGTCIHGHDAATHMRMRSNGKRECRACHREHHRRWRVRRRVERLAQRRAA